jgi:inorganic phosphate transporter, PiT family
MTISPLLELSLISLLAFYVAWNLGGNDVANSMGTSVGSKAITLKQALIIAGILEFTGAILFGQKVSSTLATKIANPSLFQDSPELLLWGMVAVLISCGLWLQIATNKGLPVASSHAIVGAIAGFSWVAVGTSAIDWPNLGKIALAWVITPMISGAIAILFYYCIRIWILNTDYPLERLKEWIPWLSVGILAIFGVIVFPTVFGESFQTPLIPLSIGGMAAISLTINAWNRLEKLKVGFKDNFDQNIYSNALEGVFARFQVLSACFVAFAHGSNDVGNAIAPLAAISYILKTNSVPLGDNFQIPYWILFLGGIGIVTGLAMSGKNVITTVGENIISLQPSSGFAAEIATATTILLASNLGIPVSTSHALVGGVIGVGIIQNIQKIRLDTVKSVILAWIITLPASAILAIIGFTIIKFLIRVS